MGDVTNELMFELLKSIPADIASLKEGQRDIRSELQSIRGTMIAMQQDIHNVYGILARHETRFDRIENRLELRELAEAQSRFEPHP